MPHTKHSPPPEQSNVLHSSFVPREFVENLGFVIILGACKQCFLRNVIISGSCSEDTFFVEMLVTMMIPVIWSSPGGSGLASALLLGTFLKILIITFINLNLRELLYFLIFRSHISQMLEHLYG